MARLEVILLACFTLTYLLNPSISVETKRQPCNDSNNVYGENDVIDQLLACSAGRAFDLDLTPQGEYIKSTSKTLVEQGLSNRTSVIYAKLSGLWTAKRSDDIESSWKCFENKTFVSSIIEFKGLSLEMVERFDVQMHKNHHKLSIHKPCKTFDLPLWLCRQSKPIYRTTRTWVNRAFFNLTLSQEAGASKPTIENLSYLFSCPETFKQKITHSPSAMYMVSRFVYGGQENSGRVNRKRQVSADNKVPVTHPASYSTNQDGRSPASPPYHTSVNLIVSLVSGELRSFFDGCILSVDCDLSMIQDSSSFHSNRFLYRKQMNNPTKGQLDGEDEDFESQTWKKNECLNEPWLRQRVELSESKSETDREEVEHSDASSHVKRSRLTLKYPKDPNQLLNPYGYYHDNSDDLLMIDDE